MPAIRLDEVAVDFEQIGAQLIFALSNYGGDSWNDVIPTSVGRTVVDFRSAIGAYGQTASLWAVQEQHVDTARAPNSIYAIMRDLGVRLQRRLPAICTARLTRNEQGFLQVPAYTQFFVSGRPFFNRLDVFFGDTDVEQTCVLYSGTVKRQSVLSQGGDFQTYFLGDTDFSLSDQDIYCLVNGNPLVRYERQTKGPWFLPEAAMLFFERTMPDGRAEVRFGTGTFGRAPTLGERLDFVYTVTGGAQDNVALAGEPVTVTGFGLGGNTTSHITGGSDSKNHEFYRLFGPNLYSAKKGAVTRSDYRAIAATYNGVIDSLFRGQAETAPDDPRYGNVVRYTLLTDPPFDDGAHERFVEYMLDGEKSQWGMRFVRDDPQPVVVDLVIDAACRPGVDTNKIKTSIEQACVTLFSLTAGSLGFSMAVSYIYEYVNSLLDGVEYINVRNPVTDIWVSPIEYVVLGKLSVNCRYTDQRKAILS
jgi:hypothetical protein